MSADRHALLNAAGTGASSLRVQTVQEVGESTAIPQAERFKEPAGAVFPGVVDDGAAAKLGARQLQQER
jgi:hypothetical protein